MKKYETRAVPTAIAMRALVEMVKKLREAAEQGEALGMNEAESASNDSLGANESAVRMVGNNAGVDIANLDFGGEGRPVLPGITEWLELVDAPGHVEDLKRKRVQRYAMKGNRIRLVTDRQMEVVEVHPPSVNSVNTTGVTVEYYPRRPAMGETDGISPRSVRECRRPGREGRVTVIDTGRMPHVSRDVVQLLSPG